VTITASIGENDLSGRTALSEAFMALFVVGAAPSLAIVFCWQIYMPDKINSRGGEGGGADTFTRREMAVFERAIRRERSFVLDQMARIDVPEGMALLATCAKSPRTRIAAAKVLVAMELANLRGKEMERKTIAPASGGTTLHININDPSEIDALIERELSNLALAREATIAGRIATPQSGANAPTGSPLDGPGADPGAGADDSLSVAGENSCPVGSTAKL